MPLIKKRNGQGALNDLDQKRDGHGAPNELLDAKIQCKCAQEYHINNYNLLEVQGPSGPLLLAFRACLTSFFCDYGTQPVFRDRAVLIILCSRSWISTGMDI